MSDDRLNDLENRVERLERELNIPEKEFESEVDRLSLTLGVDVKSVDPSEPGRVAYLELPEQIDERFREELDRFGLKWCVQTDDGHLEVW